MYLFLPLFLFTKAKKVKMKGKQTKKKKMVSSNFPHVIATNTKYQRRG